MSNPKQHTPGPWKWNFESADPEWAIVTIDVFGGKIIANVNADYRQEANARLISAAPELLASAKLALDFIQTLPSESSIAPSTKAQDALVDAIAKAEQAA